MFEELLLIEDSTTSLGIAMVVLVLLFHLHLLEVGLFLHMKKFHSFQIDGHYIKKESVQKLRQ